jgi:hypothetical protein
MNLQDVKIGQKVKIVAGNLFYAWNIDKVGTVTEVDGEYVTVFFKEDEDDDYGYASGLELVEEADVVPANIKAAIADVEEALAALKALVS